MKNDFFLIYYIDVHLLYSLQPTDSPQPTDTSQPQILSCQKHMFWHVVMSWHDNVMSHDMTCHGTTIFGFPAPENPRVPSGLMIGLSKQQLACFSWKSAILDPGSRACNELFLEKYDSYRQAVFGISFLRCRRCAFRGNLGTSWGPGWVMTLQSQPHETFLNYYGCQSFLE